MKNKDRKAVLNMIYACEFILMITVMIKLSESVPLLSMFSDRDGTMFTAGVIIGPLILHQL